MNHELAKTLTAALVQFIDETIPEGTMCCSNTECDALERAFMADNFIFVESFIQKKLSRLTEFEQEVSDIVEYCKEHGENVAFDYAKRHAKTLLSLAKKELLSYADESNPKIEAMADLERTFKCNPDNLPLWLKNELDRIKLEARAEGYSEGLQRALEVQSYHSTPITVRPHCWEPGGTCTNPQMDCVNCPRKTTGGFNTQFGTATLKADG